jgi:hypothetical protein
MIWQGERAGYLKMILAQRRLGALTDRGNPPTSHVAKKGESIEVGGGTAVAHPAFCPY